MSSTADDDVGGRSFSFFNVFKDLPPPPATEPVTQQQELITQQTTTPASVYTTAQPEGDIDSTAFPFIDDEITTMISLETIHDSRTEAFIILQSETAIPSETITNDAITEIINAANTTVGMPTFAMTNDRTDSPGIGRGFVNREDSLCGFPAFVPEPECLNSSKTTVFCGNQGEIAAIILSILLIGITTIVANSLLPIVVFKKQKMRSRHNYIKVSLCFADMVMGFVLLFGMLPNLVIMLKMNRHETFVHIYNTMNSPQNIIAGMAVNFTLQASLFHLLLLHSNRLLAITFPLWQRIRTKRSLAVELSVVWVLSLVVAAIPAFTPKDYKFVISPVLFLSFLSSTGTEYTKRFALPYTILTTALPFALTVLLAVLTACLVIHKLGISKRMKASFILSKRKPHSVHRHDMPQTNELKQEVSVFATTFLMFAAFAVTWLPFTLYTLINQGTDCEAIAVPYTATFFFLCLNSLVNPLIYTIRDRKFRITVRKVLCGCSGKDAPLSHGTKTLKTSSTEVI